MSRVKNWKPILFFSTIICDVKIIAEIEKRNAFDF